MYEVGLTALSCRSEVMGFICRARHRHRARSVAITMNKYSTNQLSMKRLRNAVSRVCGAAVVFVICATSSGYSTQNPNHSAVVSGGAVSAQSATHQVSGALGQVSSSRASSATNTLAGGFWNTVRLCKCPYIGDLDTNGVINVFDVVALVNIAFRGGAMAAGDPLCPLWTRADLTCDGVVNAQDVVVMVNTAFRGTDNRCDPCEP